MAALRRYHGALIEGREFVRARWDRQKPLPSFIDAMFDYSVTLHRAEISWVEGFITRMEEGHGED